MSKEPSKRSKITKRIIIGVAVALVLVYIVFLFITTNFLGNNNLVTETAYHAKAYDTIESKGMVVRDEEYLQSTANGVMVYDVSDGLKVTAGGTIATAYATQEDVTAVQKVEELDAQIEFLESLGAAGSSANVGIDTLNSQINERLLTLMQEKNSHDFGANMTIARDNLLTSILRKQILTGEQGNITQKIDELKSERDAVKATCGAPIGTVKSTYSGYFVSKVDGYETTFDTSKLDEIKASDVKNAKPADIDPDAYIGKVVRNVNWYLLCPVTADEATALSHSDSEVQVRLPSVLDEPIPAKIIHVNTFNDSNESLAVLQCNYMSDALSKLRQDNIEIIVNEYEGLKISKSALHDDEVTYYEEDASGNDIEKKERVQGVYIVYGAELVFKQVAITYAGDDYIICNENPDEGLLLNGSTISLYDKVVVEGGDLFNGKIIQ